jgi:hypothetical protein
VERLAARNPLFDRPSLTLIDDGIAIADQEATDRGVIGDGEAAAEALGHAEDPVLQDLGHRPSVGAGSGLAERNGNSVDRSEQDDAIRVEVAQQLVGAWVHRAKLAGAPSCRRASGAGRARTRTRAASFP